MAIVCNRCVIDDVYGNTVFDENGYCNYCTYALETMDSRWLRGSEGRDKLDEYVEKIKRDGKGKKYDCFIGLSGGLDSSYLAYFMKREYDLRMMALHVDTGWNSTVARQNIEKLCKKMDIELTVRKLPQHEFMDLQKAYLFSGVFNQDVPQDHTFIAYLFEYARENEMKYCLSGANFSTENILQRTGDRVIAADKVNLLDIHKHFGNVEINALPTISLFDRFIKYRFIYGIKMLRPLDFIDYQVKDAVRELAEDVGFEYYGGKHCESVFTRWYQNYYLPKRFNYDKRRSHLSSLIVTNQITRDEALRILEQPLYEKNQMEKDITFIINRLGMTREEFDDVMETPPREASMFRMSGWNRFGRLAVKFRTFLGE